MAHNGWVDTGTQALPGSLFVLKAASVTATAQYADTQTSWVEPSSGAPVDMTEQVRQRYVYGGRAVTAMSADLVSDPLPADRMPRSGRAPSSCPGSAPGPRRCSPSSP